MIESYICFAKRTPIGLFSGAFADTPSTVLGGALVREALKETGIPPDAPDEILMGQVLPAGVGQAPARQTGLAGGLSENVRATTLNRVCGSGLKTVLLADQAIRAGDSQLILAGGQENMTLAPHLLPKSRAGYRFGGVNLLDHMEYDGLLDPYEKIPMGRCAESCAQKYGFSRQAQDDYARESYTKARQAIEKGLFKNEILPITVKGKKADLIVDRDEEPFHADLSKMEGLRPAFLPQGTITAANASSINDGAALLVVASREAVKAHNLTPLARIVAQASHAQSPGWFTTAPIPCIEALLKKSKIKKETVDLFEINEAFSIVPMAAITELSLDPERVNVHGGAVALGHPLGASGARVLVTLIHSLHTYKKTFGIATLCIGGGEASGILIERC
jgi:acetyl-CoA C-acetyltransferase